MNQFEYENYFIEVKKLLATSSNLSKIQQTLKKDALILNMMILKNLKNQIVNQTSILIERIQIISVNNTSYVENYYNQCKNKLKDLICESKHEFKVLIKDKIYIQPPKINEALLASMILPDFLQYPKTKLNCLKSKEINNNSIKKNFDLKVCHENQVKFMLFSSINNKIFYSHSEKIIDVFDFITKANSFTFIGHKDKITDLKLNNKETILASSSFDCFIMLWDIINNCLISKISYGCPFTSIQFTNDDMKILSSSLERPLKLWSANTCKFIKSYDHSPDTISAFKLCPKGETVAICSSVILLVNFETKLLDASSHRVKTKVDSLEFSKNSDLIVFSDDKTIKIWNILNDSYRIIETFPYDLYKEISILVDSDLDIISYGINYELFFKNISNNTKSFDEVSFYCHFVYHRKILNQNQILAWTSQSGFSLVNLNDKKITIFGGHSNSYFIARINGNQTILITCANDNTLRIWNTINKSQLFVIKLKNSASALGINFDGSLIAAAGLGFVKIWKVDSNEVENKVTEVNEIKLDYRILNISIIDKEKLLLALENYEFVYLKCKSLKFER